MKKFENRIIIVTRETRLENVLANQNTISQAKFYINQLGGDFDEYQAEHTQYGSSVQEARRQIEELGNIQLLDRKYLSNFIFAADDIVVVIGQDGLVANTLKYLNSQPVIGINPDASRWDGVLLPFTPADAAKIVEETIAGKRKLEEVTMARAKVQNGQELLAVNDFFIGQKTHSSARYVIKHGGVKEPQSSSGVIVSTGLGSTGWMKSILAGASRISSSVIGKPYGTAQESENVMEADMMKYHENILSAEDRALHDSTLNRIRQIEAKAMRRLRHPKRSHKLREYLDAGQDEVLAMAENAPMLEMVPPKVFVKKKSAYGPSELSQVVGKWSSKELIFAVREPFPSKSTGTNLIFGTVSPGNPLRIESLMGENGVIFSDGIENDFITFNSGTEAVIDLADKRGRIVV
jgi:NAD kinase